MRMLRIGKLALSALALALALFCGVLTGSAGPSGASHETVLAAKASTPSAAQADCVDDEGDDALESAATPSEGEDSEGDDDDDENGDYENGTPVAPGTLSDGQDLLSQAGISVDQAVQVAQAEVDGELGPVDLEDETGTLVYKVTIGDLEVIVNAQDGTVIGTEAIDDDDNECEEDEDSGIPSTLAWSRAG